jgi:hypothetical protein
MKRILIADTYYPDFLKTLRIYTSSSYESELQSVLRLSFGTADFYSRNLRNLGWDAIDVIANCDDLQALWGKEHGCEGTLQNQIDFYKPDVVFLQDLSLVDRLTGPHNYVLAGQCSCPMPSAARVRLFEVLFTSFPHYVEQFANLGVRAVFNPLGFDPIVLQRTLEPKERDIDVSFVGGVGNPSHWKYGMEVLNAVAEAIPTFKWWGYGVETLPANSVLRDKYQGEAWGLKMYDILRRSKIVLNRHGEVAQNYANNMRMFEATGCGALLLTENAPNIRVYFGPYGDECIAHDGADNAVMLIRYFMDNAERAAVIADRGQQRTLKSHTYARRMETISYTLLRMTKAA